MCSHLLQIGKEVIVMDADGSKSGDDSIPLLFSETKLFDEDLFCAFAYDHILGSLHSR